MNTLDIRKLGCCGYQLVEYKPGLREDVHLASTSIGEVLDAAQSILRKRKTSIKPSSSLRMFIESHEA